VPKAITSEDLRERLRPARLHAVLALSSLHNIWSDWNRFPTHVRFTPDAVGLVTELDYHAAELARLAEEFMPSIRQTSEDAGYTGKRRKT
jgi:hypothetical protein